VQSSFLNEELLKGCLIMRKRQKEGGWGGRERWRMEGREDENKGVWGHFFMRLHPPKLLSVFYLRSLDMNLNSF